MSFNQLDTLYDKLQDTINDCQSDVTKFIEGNNSAGTRVRKAMQAIKSLAQEVRVEVQDQKNAQF
jgi:FtsZ-binding cell division protein ZapB